MLEYTLGDNPLSEDPDDKKAQVVNVRTYSQDEVIDKILDIGAGLTNSDVVSVLSGLKKVVTVISDEGDAVTLELFDTYPSIQGVFKGVNDSYDPKRHRTRINLRPGVALRASEKNIKTKKVPGGIHYTTIFSVMDVKSKSVDNLLTPGRNLKIFGEKIKVVGDEAITGIWFINQNDGTRTQVETSDIVTNRASEVIVVIPALTAGEYKIELKTCYSGGSTPTKTSHESTFHKVLTVE
ncbi:MAG: DUF4469 domain-containing protein [Prevotellaceae bacterium]|jgi:hypothetical protein|nr:DUF4469 domain-containing protein [Prevotellaceae bacterium]